MTTGGLGQTDIGNKAAIGGMAREFYRRIRRYYSNPSRWKRQKPEEYRSAGQSFTERREDTMWTFEPSAAAAVFRDILGEAGITPRTEEPLPARGGVERSGSRPARLLSLRSASGRRYRARMFIDATYEGDLLAQAGASYTVGRESNRVYGETLNGVQTAQAKHHQLRPGVDPYRRAGDPSSGLLPGIDPAGPGQEGAGDRRVQAYCFRLCLTDHPENRIPFFQPTGYREEDYELLFRNFEAGETAVPWNNSPMPNRKTDINNNHGVSTDFIGQNYRYPEAGWAERAAIIARHRRYQQGLLWTLANHPRVPASVRREVSRWGYCRDEFVETGGWPPQIYVREARRMLGDYVMTQHNCQGRARAPDPVGLAAYTMDSHNVQRYVNAKGWARNEGDVQVGGFPPYPISFRAIVPRREECANLLCPTCLSASHIAFGSIRMEPVFMLLGQSAACAAALAIRERTRVQDIPYPRLRRMLLDAEQRLEWKG